jgi:dipeptidase E
MSKRQLLLLSNTKNATQDHLEHATQAIVDMLGTQTQTVLFIPYAQVLSSFTALTALMRQIFQNIGYQLHSIHEATDRLAAIADAKAIFFGGGNTFNLLYHVRAYGLQEPIRARVSEGVPYIGSSAGANIACPTIKTTNDMPIIDPIGLEALNLIPFQINPHFTDAHPAGHQGESRSERIREFIELHPETHVVGLREGSMLRIEGSSIKLLGESGARIFVKGKPAKDYFPRDSVQFLFTR